MLKQDTIIALATPAGSGAIAIIRLSGPDAITLVASCFEAIGNKNLLDQKSHTVHLGHLKDGTKTLDQVLVTVFKGPSSYTGENVLEISCHGSTYIQQQIIQLFLRKGCRMASAGEFTLRAFLNGKMDLSQAEAVADLIASDSAVSHKMALQQMRGGFSNEIKILREELLNFASLIELELDFSQEDVEFADRSAFESLLGRITEVLKNLIDSFALGNVIKNGVPVAIVGEPNVGKSTLLNALLNEERAIVSEVAGTTRDTVEDQMAINGVTYRFIDTAGIRQTADQVEKIGIERSYQKIGEAHLVLYLFDAKFPKKEQLQNIKKKYPDKPLLMVANKIDGLPSEFEAKLLHSFNDILLISAKEHIGISQLKQRISELSQAGKLEKYDTIVTNNRHYDALIKALEAIQKVKEAMDEDLASDLMAIDIKEALYHLGEITGAVSTDDLLGNIFSNFCIGK